MSNTGELLDAIEHRVSRDAPPQADELAADLTAACDILETESVEIRPRDAQGRTGGIIHLIPNIPTVVLPDIHARIELLIRVLDRSFPDHGIDEPLLQAIDNGRGQLVIVGDYVHGEARVRSRWVTAFQEFQEGYRVHRAIDQEMFESLTVLQIVALLKRAYPDLVHGLKGNHENIANEEGKGNHPFGKFAYEGAMVAEYMKRFYSGDAFDAVYRFEHDLPLLAIGETFLVSHAEPLDPYTYEEILGYRDDPAVVEGLTWTDNDAAEEGSVAAMLEGFLPSQEPQNRIYLGGHRPVAGLFALRADGRYVQFHNPQRYIAAVPPRNRGFDPEIDVIEL